MYKIAFKVIRVLSKLVKVFMPALKEVFYPAIELGSFILNSLALNSKAVDVFNSYLVGFDDLRTEQLCNAIKKFDATNWRCAIDESLSDSERILLFYNTLKSQNVIAQKAYVRELVKNIVLDGVYEFLPEGYIFGKRIGLTLNFFIELSLISQNLDFDKMNNVQIFKDLSNKIQKK